MASPASGTTSPESRKAHQPGPRAVASESTPPQPRARNSSSWQRHVLHLGRRLGLRVGRWLGLRRKPQLQDRNTHGEEPLMVVATLIATITFQAALNPPGGFIEKNGKAKLGKELKFFLIADMVGLFASLSIILLVICWVPRKKNKLRRVLVWVMWVAVYSTALAFSAAIKLIFPDSIMVSILLQGWFLVLAIAVLWIYLRLFVYLLREVGWGEEEMQGRNRSAAIVVKKVVLVVLVISLPLAISQILWVPSLSVAIWIYILIHVWLLLFGIPIHVLYFQFSRYLLRKVKLLKAQDDYPATASLLFLRIPVIAMILGIPFILQIQNLVRIPVIAMILGIPFILQIQNLVVELIFRVWYLCFFSPVVYVVYLILRRWLTRRRHRERNVVP